MLRRFRLSLSVAAAVLVGGTAGPGMAETLSAEAEYSACMGQVAPVPEKALMHAERWAGLGGGAAAQHCRAAALLAMGKEEQAALILEELAQEARTSAPVKLGLLRQAARAWLTVGELVRAEGVLTAALSVAPGDADTLEDRAIVRMEQGESDRALADLTAALTAQPERLSALVLRAAAQRRAGDLNRAAEDLTRAALLNGDHPDVLLESGALSLARRDKAQARAAWLRLLAVAPDGPAADAARNQLSVMDGG